MHDQDEFCSAPRFQHVKNTITDIYSTDNMSWFETHGAVMNLVQVIDVVSPHTQDNKNVKDVLEDAEASTKRICQNIREVKQLPGAPSVLSVFIDQTNAQLQKIRDELFRVQENVVNRATSRSAVMSPATLAQLKQIL